MTATEIDFTGVEGRSGPGIRVREGNYPLRIDGVDTEAKAKKTGNRMWVFDMVIVEGPDQGKKLKERCTLTPDALFRLRDLLEACGYNIPSAKISIDPTKLKGKVVGAYIRDGEPYGDRKVITSEIAYYVPLKEVREFPAWANEAGGSGSTSSDSGAGDGLDVFASTLAEGEDDEPAPTAAPSVEEPASAPEPEEDDDEELDDEEGAEGYTEAQLEEMERKQILEIAKEMGVKRTKGKHTGTYIKEILEVQAAMAEEEFDDDDEPTAAPAASTPEDDFTEDASGVFSLDDLT